MRIRAAVLERFGSPLNVTEVDLAEPKRGEALVRLLACGVCHTDLYTASAPICVDLSQERLSMAGAQGATDLWQAGSDVVERVIEQTGGFGADYGVKGRDQVPQLVDRYLAGEIDVETFISHRISLEEVNRGFELMEAKDGIRSVIGFG